MDKVKLQQELTKSMLARSELKTSVLRMLISAINYYEIQKGGAGYSANEQDIISVIGSQAKQRRDSIEEYNKANRPELADKEQKELEILQTYMPAQMGEEEIKKLVDQAVSQANASTIQDMGKVMGILMPKVKGKADGSLVSNLVKQALTS
ncbi:MAG: GatB/Yqey domain protein [Candidatus Levybacteria bacterium GW2011_GWB1_35_5]|nr:MAG: GatB/Yqey domain protein [Candidatus Levybacteria bacterium GW2011_GWB1_35_5]